MKPERDLSPSALYARARGLTRLLGFRPPLIGYGAPPSWLKDWVAKEQLRLRAAARAARSDRFYWHGAPGNTGRFAARPGANKPPCLFESHKLDVRSENLAGAAAGGGVSVTPPLTTQANQSKKPILQGS